METCHVCLTAYDPSLPFQHRVLYLHLSSLCSATLLWCAAQQHHPNPASMMITHAIFLPLSLQVMELLVQNAIHRVYVVDGHRHPIGIITATDILRALLHVAT
jgi:hypothetical protein